MKLTCDLCGGGLQMNAGGKEASCKVCGLCYSMEVLREKLGLSVKKAEPTPVAPTPAPAAPTPAPEEPAQKEEAFCMDVDKLVGTYLIGRVQQGCVGIGETVYLNGDRSCAYRVYSFGDSVDTVRATAGMEVELRLNGCPKSQLKQVRSLTGEPGQNAYHFPGDADAYFAWLLGAHFGGYTLQTQVAWEGLNRPLNFLLLKDGAPALGIMLFDSHDAKGRYQAQKAASLFAQKGIGFTHFFADYRNDADYAVDRIRCAIR